MTTLREGLPVLPPRMRSLPIDARGYPVPWFVAWVNGEPEFRALDAEKMAKADRFRLCWVCGQPVGKYATFVIGPMCAVNRTTSEPPCHLDCAIFSATACPFLTLPKAKRNERNLPSDATDPPGEFLTRNPGVTCLWTSETWQWFPRRQWPVDPAWRAVGGALVCAKAQGNARRGARLDRFGHADLARARTG